VEIGIALKATNWLTLSGNYAYTNAKAKKGTQNTLGTIFGGNMSVAGFSLPRSPKHAAAGSAAVDLPTSWSGMRFFARADITYQSRRYADLANTIWADPFTHVNLSAGLRGQGWRGSLWVKNATNDDNALDGFSYLDGATFRNTAADFLPRRRQIGATVSYDF